MPPVKNAVFREHLRGGRVRTSWLARPSARPPMPELPKPPPLPSFDLASLIGQGAGDTAPAESGELHDAPRPPSDTAPPYGAPAATPPTDPRPPDSAVFEVVERLERSLADIVTLRSRVLADTERQLVELATAIARRVVGQELRTHPKLIADLAREGIESLAERDHVTVRIGAILDEETLASLLEALHAQAPDCQVVFDRALGPGGCLVEADLGHVDQSLEARLAHIVESLSPEVEAT